MPDSRPRMVDRWRLIGSQQPILAKRTRMYGFAFLVDQDRLAATCKRYLYDPSHGKVDCRPPTLPEALRPILPDAIEDKHGIVVLTFVRIDRLSSVDEPFSQVGWASETEATFWALTPDRSGFLPKLRWFVPYIFVDLPMAISMGREIYGFPKEIAWFDAPPVADWYATPADGPHADTFSVDVFGVERFARGPFSQQRLLTIARPPQGPPDATSQRWADHQGAIADFAERFFHRTGLAKVLDLDDDLWPPGVTAILLKQFPNTADGEYACHQSIVDAKGVVQEFDGGWWLRGDYRLDLRNLESHPIAADLGLDDGSKALAGWWMDFDFRMDAGTQVWP